MPTPSSNVLTVFALENEAQACFDDFVKVFCGVGKVNAVYHLTRSLMAWRTKHGRNPDMVLNLGSAGSTEFKTRAVVNCTRFIQRDIDTTILGTAPYATFSEDLPPILANGLRFDMHPDAICGSGDSFVSNNAKMPWNVMDMEAYALAKVCLLESVPFGCLKFITDGADGQAASDWKTVLNEAAVGLRMGVELILMERAA